jgi:hypothetical protein
MSRFPINKAWASAGFLCLIGCTLMLTLSLTVTPKDWVNAGLGGAVALGLLSAGWSAAAVTPNSGAP